MACRKPGEICCSGIELKENKAPRHCFTRSSHLPPSFPPRNAAGGTCPLLAHPSSSAVAATGILIILISAATLSILAKPPGLSLKIGGSVQVPCPCRDTQDAGLGLPSPAGECPHSSWELGSFLCSRFTSLNTQTMLKRR